MPACRSCGAEILFVRTASGRLNPLSKQTGRSHFEDCPNAVDWRKGRPVLAAQVAEVEAAGTGQPMLPGFEEAH
jgi:hypothetical protein